MLMHKRRCLTTRLLNRFADTMLLGMPTHKRSRALTLSIQRMESMDTQSSTPQGDMESPLPSRLTYTTPISRPGRPLVARVEGIDCGMVQVDAQIRCLIRVCALYWCAQQQPAPPPTATWPPTPILPALAHPNPPQAVRPHGRSSSSIIQCHSTDGIGSIQCYSVQIQPGPLPAKSGDVSWAYKKFPICSPHWPLPTDEAVSTSRYPPHSEL